MNFSSLNEHELIEGYLSILGKKDSYTAGHSRRVAMYSSKIAMGLNLSEEEQIDIYAVGLLHDIGKIITPDVILLKPQTLTRSEFKIIQDHAMDGAVVIEGIDCLRKYSSIVRSHHEWYDGRGYPDGLQGEQIPLLSRIITLADAFDAMTTNRIYKNRKTKEGAFHEIQKCSGTQFDPHLIDVACELLGQFNVIDHVLQNPEQGTHEHRFAFYFKDRLTGIYSSEYLDYFFQQNRHSAFDGCYFLQLHNLRQYNTQYGWELGNNLIKHLSMRIKYLFKTSYVFRIFGTNFVIFHAKDCFIEEDEVIYRLRKGYEEIGVSLLYFDLAHSNIKRYDMFENHFLRWFRVI